MSTEVQTPGLPSPVRTKGRRKLFFLRYVVSGGILILILKWIDISVLKETISNADPLYIALILAAAITDRYLMAYKWNLLLGVAGTQISNIEAFKFYLSSSFVSTFLPTGVGGDAFRIVRTSLSGHRVGKVTASIVVERVIGFLVVIVTAVVALSILVYSGDTKFSELHITMCGVLVAFLVTLLLSVHPHSYRIIKKLLSRFERNKLVSTLLELHGAYVEFGKHKRILLLFTSLTFLELGIMILINYWGARAIGLTVGYPTLAAIIPITAIVIRLPISIGGFGVHEGTYMILFSRVGLAPTQALSLALILRVIEMIMLVPTGIVFLIDVLRFRRKQRSV